MKIEPLDSEFHTRHRSEAEVRRAKLEAAAKAERASGTEHGAAFNALILDGAFTRYTRPDGKWDYVDRYGNGVDGKPVVR